MPSFDAVLEPNLVELRNAVEQANREIATRFDFKGTPAKIESSEAGKSRLLDLYGESDFQLDQVRDILLAKLAKRGVDARFLDRDAPTEKLGGDRMRHRITVKSGIDAETAKKMQQALKQGKLKVQAAYQGDALRVSGAKRDELQAAIALLRRTISDLPLTFGNFRE